MNRTVLFIILSVSVLLLFMADVFTGNLAIPVGEVLKALRGEEVDGSVKTIVLNIRLVKALVAVVVGVALSVSGLQMQTVFRNPLAGPYVLGISSGASLGVALLVLAGVGSSMGVAAAAWAGAAAVLVVVACVAHRIRDIMAVLILGMMFSAGVGAVVQILQYLSRDEALKTFVVWTMGTLADVTFQQLWIMIIAIAIGLLLAVLTLKQLNLLLMGEEYAVSMGVDLKRSRAVIFMSTTLLAGTATAFCGPIGFVGLAIPHVARALCSTADHRTLLPATALVGASVMLLCDIVSKLYVIPVNSVTALFGIPIVVWIVWRNR